MLQRLNLFVLLLLVLLLLGVGLYIFADANRNQRLIIAAGSRSSEAFALAEAIATVVERYHPKIQVDVIETAGSLDNDRLIEQGYADMATLQADASASSSARLVANLYPDAFQLVAHADSDIKTFADLRGRKVALPSRGSGQYASFWFLARHYGLNEGDFTALPMSSRASEWALYSGAADAVFRVRAPGDSSVMRLVKMANTRLIPIDQAPALHIRHPSIIDGIVPKGSYRGDPPLPIGDLHTAIVMRLLVAREDLDRELVHEVTRLMFEHRRELSEINPLAAMIQGPESGTGTYLPLHEGAAQYFDREKPSFWTQQADLMRTLLSIFAIGGSLIFAFRNWLQSVQKDRADAYNKDLIALYEESLIGEKPSEYYRTRLADILRKVVDDLDNDRISRDGFDLFSFTWQSVSRLVLDLPAGWGGRRQPPAAIEDRSS